MLQHVTTVASIRKPFSRCLFRLFFHRFFHSLDWQVKRIITLLYMMNSPSSRGAGGVKTEIFQKLKGHPPPHTEKYVSCYALAGTGGCGEVPTNRPKCVFPCCFLSPRIACDIFEIIFKDHRQGFGAVILCGLLFWFGWMCISNYPIDISRLKSGIRRTHLFFEAHKTCGGVQIS